MLFNSYLFIFAFLPLALAGFFLLAKLHHRAASVWLVAVSLCFYAFWNPSYVPLLLASFLFNFAIGEAIHAWTGRSKRQRTALVVGIGGDLAVLFYYKYLAALLGLIATLGLTHAAPPDLLLPLGMSFFTFTQIGYLVDVQQGVARQRGMLNFLMLVTFFPHLIAGPILHNQEIMPQFAERQTYRFSGENLTVGLMMFIIGLAKKCLFADPIAGAVAAGFAAPGQLAVLPAWLLMLTYALQLYFDFSGYTDMAIGIARMFNVHFPVNFNSPFKATSIIDYWQRWHMTLTRFLTLYLFNPMALGAARRRARRGLQAGRAAQATPRGFITMVAVPILITMGLAGIWHGAGVRYLIFGALHGTYLTINHAWRTLRGPRHTPSGPLVRGGNLLLTLASVLVALVFFRAPSMGAAGDVLAAMTGLHGFGSLGLPVGLLGRLGVAGQAALRLGLGTAISPAEFGQHALQVAWIGLLCAVVWGLPNSQQILRGYAPVLGRVSPGGSALLTWRPALDWAVAFGVIAAVSVVAIGGTGEFLYFQF